MPMSAMVVIQLLVAAASVLTTVSATAPADSISLDGEWSFALDAADIGLRSGWHSAPSFAHSITVPGVSVGAAGFGNPTDAKHHEYVGVSWFAKNATLPAEWLLDDDGDGLLAVPGALALSCGGVKNSATFFADGVPIGNHSGYMDGFELDLHPWLQQRQAAQLDVARTTETTTTEVRLTVRLDGTRCFANNSNTTVCGCGGACFSSANSGAWSGIWGHVALVRRTSFSLDQLTIKTLSLPGVDGAAATGAASIEVSAQLGNGRRTLADYSDEDDLQVSVVISEHDSGRVTLQKVVPLRDVLQQPTLRGGGGEEQTEKPIVKLILPIAEPKLWSPLSPSLYHANISLSADGGGSAHTRFGLRTVVIDGQYFLLNGKRHFLVGTGDDFGYPGEAPPQNMAVLRARLGAMKEYGFDFVRLHSHFEAKSYFDAADELGFFISPALQQGGVCHEQLLRTWKFWLNELRNSPSVMDMNMANEAV
eukprot:SAG31_NODE_2165_length_6281_cov_2.028308_2_plen_479_part_00